jgi:hypothetical protein
MRKIIGKFGRRTGCYNVMAMPSFGLSNLTGQVENAVPIHKTEATTDQWLVCIKNQHAYY